MANPQSTTIAFTLCVQFALYIGSLLSFDFLLLFCWTFVCINNPLHTIQYTRGPPEYMHMYNIYSRRHFSSRLDCIICSQCSIYIRTYIAGKHDGKTLLKSESIKSYRSALALFTSVKYRSMGCVVITKLFVSFNIFTSMSDNDQR